MTTKKELKAQAAEYAEGWGIDPEIKPRAKKGTDEFTDGAIEHGLVEGEAEPAEVQK